MRKRDLSGYDEIIQGLEIFKKYPNHSHAIGGGHDVVWAGPNPNDVSAEDMERLKELGWDVNEWVEAFEHYASI